MKKATNQATHHGPKRNKHRGLSRSEITIGDTVHVIDTIAAYYSEYGGRPKIELTPDILGIVSAVEVPYVRHGSQYDHKYEVFVCVDFISPATGRIERAGVDYGNLQKVEAQDE